MDHALLTAKDAAIFLNLTPRFLQHDRSNRQTIPFLKINHLIRYDPEDLRDFIEKAKQGGVEK